MSTLGGVQYTRGYHEYTVDIMINVGEGYWENNKHLLDQTKSNIRFVLPGQMMLGEAKQCTCNNDKMSQFPCLLVLV